MSTQATQNRIERIKQIAAELREVFPGMTSIMLDARNTGDGPTEDVSVHGVETYSQSTELFRSLGIGQRKKTPYNDETIGVYTAVTGSLGSFTLTTYPNELPPSCHIETVIEKVPKQQTVDTGEFIEIERRKVVCGREMEVA